MTPETFFETLRGKLKKEWKAAFLSAIIVGLLVHLPVMINDLPNHDGLDSIYFDQNMITSGRWFLTVACGFSSYYSLPWVIGILGIVTLAVTAVILTELLDIRKSWAAVLTGGLLAAFPALASTFAYVFTLDGYMLGMLLAAAAVLFTKKCARGFLPGAACLAFSMGIYQAYLPMAMILCLFALVMLVQEEKSGKQKLQEAVRYPLMGIIGVAGYYIILQILLAIQGKQLASYQGIDGMASGKDSGLIATAVHMYRDFLAFTLKGNVLFNNLISGMLLAVLVLSFCITLLAAALQKKWWKNWRFFGIILLACVLLPPVTNIILLVSPGVTYHLLMRYQWVLYLIGMVAFVSRHADAVSKKHLVEWAALLSAAGMIFFYGVTDNIAYSNLEKKYEKTYAYCVRLLDRIEQTEGYYRGMPVAMIGVVGTDAYPLTDVTQPVTANMIGMSGDWLLYTGNNYRLFMEHYLGASLNILPAEAMAEMYYDERYKALDSFPGENSIAIIDGVLYVKTENIDR